MNSTRFVSSQIRKIPSAIRRLYFHTQSGQKRFQPESAMLIFADPRGGSTWLSQVLSGIPKTALFWEPLNVGETKIFENFRYRHFIPEDDQDELAHQRFEDLFSGKHLDPYVMHRTSVQDLRTARQALVKFCRGTQLLPWLVRNFSFKRPPVHLIRHPCAVVASQMRFGAWSNVPTSFSESEIDSDPLLVPHKGILLEIDTIEERLAAFWAMTNAIALNHFARGTKWTTIYYEELLGDPISVVEGILDRWQVEVSIPIQALASQPSGTTIGGSPVLTGNTEKQLTYWKSSLNAEQVRRVLSMVHKLGVRDYDEDPYPLARKLQ